MADWIDATVAHLERGLERIEVLENDGRHGIGSPWLVVRGWTRAVPIPVPHTLYIGERRTPRLRRLYAHPSGLLVEGGRGGARVFITNPSASPHPFLSPIEPTGTALRARSIRFAVAIVEALAAVSV